MKVHYYKRHSKMSEFFTYNSFSIKEYEGRPVVFIPSEFKNEYVELPIKLANLELEKVFHVLNVGDGTNPNPMATKENQDWIRASETRHTSMSCGDMIETEDGTWYVVLDVGFGKIVWIEER